MRISIVAGTRPEFIKVLPLYNQLISRKINTNIVFTGQHSELAEDYVAHYNIKTPSSPIDSEMSLNDKIAHFSSAISRDIDSNQSTDVVVQGDTATALAGALAGTFAQKRVLHLEAGLRSFDSYDPWPEEKIRKAISQMADIHFAPTEGARANLEAEQIDPKSIFVTGNTSVDALLELGLDFKLPNRARKVTITLHRRESHGQPRVRALKKIIHIARANPELVFVFVRHPNPQVVEDFERVNFGNLDNVKFEQPLSHIEFVRLLRDSCAVISDSGGVQEEAPTIGTPVFVARNVTERPEGIKAGFALLAGRSLERLTDESFRQFVDSFDERVERTPNPYGDGLAAAKVADIIETTAEKQ